MPPSRLIGLVVLCVVLTGCVTAKKYNALKKKWTETGEQVRHAEEINQALNVDLDQAAIAARKLGREIQGLSAERDSLLKTKADLDRALTAKKGELTAMVSRLNEEKAALNKEKTNLSIELEDLKTQSAKLTSQVGKLQDAKTGLKSSLTESVAAVAALEASLAVLKKTKKQLETENEALAKEKEAQLAQVKKNYEDLMSGLKKEVHAGQLQISNLKGKLTVNVADTLLFTSGGSEIKKSGQDVMKRLGKVLSRVEGKIIRVEGHTDNIPVGGKLKELYPTNWELSASRAINVVRYLQENAGIPAERLAAIGFGSNRPVADNSTMLGRAKNRRIEITLVDPPIDRKALKATKSAKK